MSSSELTPLVDQTRLPNPAHAPEVEPEIDDADLDLDHDGLDGPELEAMLHTERSRSAMSAPTMPPAPPPTPAALIPAPIAAAPKNLQTVIATSTPSAQVVTSFSTSERPRLITPTVTTGPSVVVSPELLAPLRPSQPSPLPSGPEIAAALPPADPFASPPPPSLPRVAPPLPPPTPSRTGVLFVVGGATLLILALIALFLALSGGGDSSGSGALPPDTTATALAAVTSKPSPAASPANPAASTTATAAASAPAPSAGASSAPAAMPAHEVEARAALKRMRDGVGICVRSVIGVLPGTAPAVPLAFSLLRRGTYEAALRDYRSPVFTCIKYKDVGPQRFQIQWQMVKRPREGRGVAWLDDNGDGKADRAIGFRASYVLRNVVELGEIEPIEPMPKVMKAPP